MSRTRRPVPVMVIAGYLGAGKSTLLNHLLSGADGARIGVVVNDFGAVNIDALLVTGGAGGAVQSVALSNGCVCCTVDDGEIEDVLDSLAARGLDLIVVEASGLAEPAAMVRRVILAANARFDFGGLVYVADAAHLPETMQRHPSLRHHLALADLVVLNKIDLVADADAAHRLVREHAGSAPIVAAVNAAVPPHLLIDAEVLAARAAARASQMRQLTLDEALRADEHCSAGHAHLHDHYSAVDVVADRLDARLAAALLTDPPRGVFRIKGFVTVADGTRLEVHTVGRHVRTSPARGVRAGSPTLLVFLGIALDAAAIDQRVKLCVARSEASVDPQAVLSLTRFSVTAR